MGRLSDLDTYTQLMERVRTIGVKVTRVVYRGYHAAGNLQEMHNQAIERRTRLRLDGEAESTAQEIENLKLKGQSERMQVKNQMEEEERRHANSLLNMDHSERLAREKRDREEKEEAARRENEEKERHLKALEGMGVDLTKVLVAPYVTPTEFIRIEGGEGGSGVSGGAQLHLHRGEREKEREKRRA